MMDTFSNNLLIFNQKYPNESPPQKTYLPFDAAKKTSNASASQQALLRPLLPPKTSQSQGFVNFFFAHFPDFTHLKPLNRQLLHGPAN